jgi:hypothetical protein
LKNKERKKKDELSSDPLRFECKKRHGSEDNAPVSWKKSHFAQRLDNASRV